MNITRAKLKETLRTIVNEESEYQSFFKSALEKAGKSIPSMSDEEKKAFFDKIDAAWDGRGEKNEALVGGQKELDVDSDGDIEGDDLADLRAGKKADESINEEEIKWNAVENAIINFLKSNTKILDKRVKDRDTDGVKGGLKSIISGLTNAQRSLKLESVKEEKPGLWANIRAKRARGEKPAHGNSDAHKDAVAAGKKINKEESVNEAPDTKKRFMFDFYTDSFQRNTERETNFMATTLESAIKAAEHICKVTGYGYVEIYYKDLFLGSMKKKDGFKFVEGRGYNKFNSAN
jgi:hypothetical protein